MTPKNQHPEQDPAEGARDLPPPGPGSPRTDEEPTRTTDDKASDDAQPAP